MLKRKKRMQFDPPGSKSKGRKSGRPRRVDQIFLTRRVFMVKGVVIAGFATLAARLAQMQLLHGEEYTEQAKGNVVSWKERKPIRGLIMDRSGRILAENKRSWEVQLLMQELPRRDTPEFEEVRNRLITALGLPQCLMIDPQAVPKNSETTVYTRVARLLGDTSPSDIQDRIDYINASAKYNYVVLARRELTADQAALITGALPELPGVQVVNYFDYLVRNFRFTETPVSVKRDVTRDVALKLEANRLYMPGVVLDDTVLTRHYPGGPVMSHILGYVGKIQDGDLNSEENILRKEGTRTYYRVYQPDDYIGQTGIERHLEELLRGSKGGAFYERDANGVELRELAGTTPAVPGKNLKLTIDLELQSAISTALSEGIALSTQDRKSKASPEKPAKACRGGAVVMLSPKTGEVNALVSYPNYDNQLFIDGLSELKAREYGLVDSPEVAAAKAEAAAKDEVYIAPQVDDITDPLTDRAYAGAYAPGSTLKLFIALAGLREKVITGDTQFTCTGAIQVPHTWNEADGNYYYCWIHTAGTGQHGPVNVIDAITGSCDIYFYNTGTPRQKPEGATLYLHYYDYNSSTKQLGAVHDFEGLGIEKIHKNLSKRFWFGAPTGIDLPFERGGIVPNQEWKSKTLDDGWSSGDTINTSIGQGYFESSPLQIAVNTAAIANGGLILRPRLVHSIVDDKASDLQKFKAEKLRRVTIEDDHLALVREGMRRVVHDQSGTAHHSLDPETGGQVTKWPLTNPEGQEEIIIAGKTGTAEVGAVNEDGTYSESHAWFTCYAPMDDPEVVLTVFLERGGEGATYAVPIADKALRAYFELTGRRPRGAVLREDKQPINERNPKPDGSTTSTGTPTAETEA